MNPDPLSAFVERLGRSPGNGNVLWRDARGEVVGRFLGVDLGSVFQPVREAATLRIVGHEAFVRCHDESDDGLSPWSLFAHAATDEQLIELDRACRTVHAIRYFAQRPVEGSLFLNVHGRLMLAVQEDHGRTFRGILESLGIAVGRIVIESPDALTDNLELLGCVMQNYRRNGYGVAINLACPDQAPALLGRFAPDLLKVHARRLRSSEQLAELVARAARRRVQVIVKRVETSRQLALCMRGGAHLLQGHALDRESGRVGAAAANTVGSCVPRVPA